MKTKTKVKVKTDQGAVSEVPVDESGESEITLQPDGRIFAFGITAGLADLLRALPMADDRARRLLDRLAGLSHGEQQEQQPQEQNVTEEPR